MYIKGVGMTKFGINNKFSHLMAYDATLEALKDADIPFSKIDAVVTSSLEWFFSIEKQRHFSSLMASVFKTRKPIHWIPAACGGGGTALWYANQLPYDNVLVLGVEKLMTCKTEAITDEFMMAAESKYEQREGLCFPAQNALVAQEYLLKHKETTTDHLAKIAFKNHNNAVNNPKAKFFQKKVSFEKIKNSPMVSTPLRLMDCSISVDGSAATILSKDKTDIKIAGSGLCTDYLPTFERECASSWYATKKSSEKAYSTADLSPDDISFAELHDAFTIIELLQYEDLGFTKPGTAYQKIDDGYFEMDGKLPVSPSGGLKAKGHPISATGLAQVYEVVKQQRREATDRQLSDVKYGLTCNIGGAGGTITTHIFKKI